MSDCLVLVGLIGAGKTTLASALESERVRIDFDHEWHECVQRESGGEPRHVVENVAYILDQVGDVVIDGWWTWSAEWWKTPADVTLDDLRTKVGHDIRVVHLAMTTRQAIAAHAAKHATGQYRGTLLDDLDAYAASVPERQAYLAGKVTQWAT